MGTGYDAEDLCRLGAERRFTGDGHPEAAFLLGGIGTGNVSLGSRGQLKDWEIFNSSSKGRINPNSHFSLRLREHGRAPIGRILESQLTPPIQGTNGLQPYTAGGLPRFARSTMRGEYPFVRIDLEDDALPVRVRLEAFTPFIPLNVADSSLPGALFTYAVENVSANDVDVTVVCSLMNPVGGVGYDEYGNLQCRDAGANRNEFRRGDGMAGIHMDGARYGPETLQYGNLSVVTTNRDITCKTAWFRGQWWDFLQDFWDDLMEDGRLTDFGYETPSAAGETDTGSLGALATLASGETREFRFVIAWYFPNRINGWNEEFRVRDPARLTVRNDYAQRFAGSWDVAQYLVTEHERLARETRAFHDALFGTSLPGFVLDAVANNLTALRSNTCFLLEDGSFHGFEGSFREGGSCPGNCTHVWNFVQSVAFLFPELEKSMRRTEYLEELEPDGNMNFRALKRFDSVWKWNGEVGPPAADGQMGSIVRAYREWRLTGDDDFIRELWPGMKRSLDFAWKRWDPDGDRVFEADQHCCYDIEIHGATTLTATHLLGALRAMEEIARHLGESEFADRMRDLFRESSRRTDERLWNGEYYVQDIPDVDAHKYQYGSGCLSDQLVGQQIAHVVGLGYLLPEERVRRAIHSVYRYNFRESFREHCNCQRTYAVGDEKGLVLCSWPRGGRPRFPFVYSDEVWTGVEYAVAVALVYEGWTDEALAVVKAVQDRQDGVFRNPWNEIECGNHYVRAMSSWGLLIAFSGFSADLVAGVMRFDPKFHPEDFRTFWSMGSAWGTYRQFQESDGGWTADVEVLHGDATGIRVTACGRTWVLP